MRPNNKKLKDLIVFILQRYNNQYLTETKLQKLLYFCDFGSYSENGKSITGYIYRKNHFGPTIMSLPEILLELKQDRVINIHLARNHYGNEKKTFSLNVSEVDTEQGFAKEELYIIQGVNEAYEKLTPSEISKISHFDAPYLAASSQGDVIDYDAVVYRDGPEEMSCKEDNEAAEFFGSESFKGLMDSVARKFGVSNHNAVA